MHLIQLMLGQCYYSLALQKKSKNSASREEVELWRTWRAKLSHAAVTASEMGGVIGTERPSWL
jgi:hypothetical protein